MSEDMPKKEVKISKIQMLEDTVVRQGELIHSMMRFISFFANRTGIGNPKLEQFGMLPCTLDPKDMKKYKD